MIKNSKIALIFRFISLIIALLGFFSMTGLFEGRFHLSSLVYYTMQSNILIIILFLMLTLRTLWEVRNPKYGNAAFYARFEMVCVLNIFITFIVYWVMLAPEHFTMGGSDGLWNFGNLAVHGITPLLCLIDYVLFTQPRHLKYRDVYYVCIFPFLYIIVTSIAGLLGYVYYISAYDGLPVRFPYFFFDFDRIGLYSLIYIIALTAFFLLLGHIMYFIDSRLRKA